MTDKLLPCPFCGGEATVGTIPIVGGGYLYAFVECLSETCNGSSGQHDTESEAIAAWNSRTQPENEPLTLDELRQMDGEPVWVEESNLWYGGNGVVSLAKGGVINPDDPEGDWPFENYGDWPFENYGEWIAFRSKPKEEHHEDD